MLSLDSGWWRRHPFERLVSAYCHLFLHGGWRLLEVSCDWWRAVHTSDWSGAAGGVLCQQAKVRDLFAAGGDPVHPRPALGPLLVHLHHLPHRRHRQKSRRRHQSLKRRSIRRFVIPEKAPTRAFSCLKDATTAFTFKTLLRHYAERTLTTR